MVSLSLCLQVGLPVPGNVPGNVPANVCLPVYLRRPPRNNVSTKMQGPVLEMHVVVSYISHIVFVYIAISAWAEV